MLLLNSCVCVLTWSLFWGVKEPWITPRSVSFRGFIQNFPRVSPPLSYASLPPMVGEMVQNSQSLFSFTFNALIDIHEYIYSHSKTEFTFKKYIYSHLPVYFLFTIIFAHIYEMSSFTFDELYPSTFTVEIFIQHFLRITFAHRSV